MVLASTALVAIVCRMRTNHALEKAKNILNMLSPGDLKKELKSMKRIYNSCFRVQSGPFLTDKGNSPNILHGN